MHGNANKKSSRRDVDKVEVPESESTIPSD